MQLQWFRKIDGTQLIKGRPYLIDGNYCIYIDLLPSHPNYYYYFRWAKHYKTTLTFYEWIPKKEQIQWQMERRAVNQIVRRLIGDDYFQW